MKLTTSNPATSAPVRRSQRGFMVIAMLALLSLMLIYVVASTRSLHQLRRELQLMEQKQVQRLHASAPPATHPNAAVAAP